MTVDTPPPAAMLPRAAGSYAEHAMNDWLDISRWSESITMARPGIIFEIQNADGQTMMAQCAIPLPAAPFDWTSPPARFRAVTEAPPARSTPAPTPKR